MGTCVAVSACRVLLNFIAFYLFSTNVLLISRGGSFHLNSLSHLNESNLTKSDLRRLASKVLDSAGDALALFSEDSPNWRGLELDKRAFTPKVLGFRCIEAHCLASSPVDGGGAIRDLGAEVLASRTYGADLRTHRKIQIRALQRSDK